MPVRDALHYQVQLRTDFESPGSMLGAMIDAFDRSQRGMPKPPGGPDALPNPVGIFAPPEWGGLPYEEGRLPRIMSNALQAAYPFYIEPHMTPVVTAAAESMPAEPLLPQDLPTQQGFLYLPHGLASVDIRGKLLVHNCVLWSVRGSGVDVYWLTNKYDDRDQINIELRQMFGDKHFEQMPLLNLAMYTRVDFGQPPPVTIGGTKVLPPEISQSLKVTRDPVTGSYAWYWPTGYDMHEWMAEAAEPRPESCTRWLMATWRLMQQTITSLPIEEVERTLRKQARRVQMQQNAVTVIKLRRAKGREGEGEGGYEYSHRFWRRGHWRMSWCGSGTDKYQRAVYIHPTEVNKERAELPLLVRDHVYDLSR